MWTPTSITRMLQHYYEQIQGPNSDVQSRSTDVPDSPNDDFDPLGDIGGGFFAANNADASFDAARDIGDGSAESPDFDMPDLRYFNSSGTSPLIDEEPDQVDDAAPEELDTEAPTEIDNKASRTLTANRSAPQQAGPTYVQLDQRLEDEIARREQSDPAGAKALRELSEQPVSKWMNGGADDQRNLQAYLDGAQKSGKEGSVTFYNIPHRDLGNFSAGGANNNDEYRQWSQNMSNVIGDKKVTVYLEPDALMDSTKMSAAEGSDRRKLLNDTVNLLKANNPNATVMLAAGSAGWGSPADVAKNLKEAGIEHADGFSVGESGFISTAKQMRYGDAIIAELAKSDVTGKQYDIETARNGAEINAAGDAAWADPDGAASGMKPTTDQAIIQNPNVRAFVHIKTPWQADGRIAQAGSFVPDYAINLVKNAHSLGVW